MKNCPKCGIEHNANGKYCSRKCANSRQWSESHKLKLSASVSNSSKHKIAAEQWKRRNSETRNCLACGKSFVCRKKKIKKYCSLICSANHVDRKEGISLTRKALFQKGKLNVTGGTTKWISVETSIGLLKVQGSYEKRVCKILDRWKKQNKIKNWEYTKDRVDYIGVDQKEHSYLLDFKVWNNDNSFYYIETKGYAEDNDLLKWEAVKQKGYELQIWFKENIIQKELEIKLTRWKR